MEVWKAHYDKTSFPCQYRQSQLRRPMGQELALAGYTYMPARAGYAHTLANEGGRRYNMVVPAMALEREQRMRDNPSQWCLYL